MSNFAYTIGIAALVFAVVFQFGLFVYAMRKGINLGQPPGEGYAPGWQVRCPKCGLTVDAGKAGLIRVGYRGSGYNFRRGWCDGCHQKRWLAIERVGEVSNGKMAVEGGALRPGRSTRFMQEIKRPEELESVLAGSTEQPVFIFKHSTRCPTSAGAYRRLSDYVADADDADKEHPPVYLVKVVESRPLSNAVQDALGVIHQSPQIILVKDGQSVWSTTHHNITGEAMDNALAKAKVRT